MKNQKNILNKSLFSRKCFFAPDKIDLKNYFTKSKVCSCKRIVFLRNGNSLAISYNVPYPFKTDKKLGFSSSCSDYEKLMKSTYRNDYAQRFNMHLGMAKKPLVPYNPDSYRNRLPLPEFSVEKHKLKDSFTELPKLINKKRWISTNKDNYRYPIPLHISNSGIMADIAKRHRINLQS